MALSLAAVLIAAVVLSVFIVMIRSGTGVVGLDSEIAVWAAAHASAASIQLLGYVTHAGDALVVVLITLLLIAYVARNPERRTLILFILTVVGGQALLANLLKISVGRVRPDLPPFDLFSGWSFPSGHATAAAAAWLVVAVVLGNGRSRWGRALFSGAAAGLAVAVACSRVFIGAHWTSDVIGGLILGWTWFGLCLAVFGPRVLHHDASAARVGPAAQAAQITGRPPRRSRSA